MKKQSFYKGSAILVSMVILTKIIGLLYKIPLTNMLGGQGMAYSSGAYAIFTPVFAAAVYGTVFGEICADTSEAELKALPYIAAASIAGVSLSTGIATIYLIIKCHKSRHSLEKNTHSYNVIYSTRSILKKFFSYCVPAAITGMLATIIAMIDLLTIKPCLERLITTGQHTFKDIASKNLTADMIPDFVYGSYAGLALIIAGLVPSLTAMFGKSILPALSESYTLRISLPPEKTSRI